MFIGTMPGGVHPTDCYCNECTGILTNATGKRIQPPRRAKPTPDNRKQLTLDEMSKNYGAIRRINQARAARRAGPSSRITEVDLEEEEEVLPQPAQAVQPMDQEATQRASSTGGGNGGTVEKQAPLLPALHNRGFTIVFRHRQEWSFKNCVSGATINLANARGIGGQMKWSDFQTFNDHVLGFYMTKNQLAEVFMNPMIRTIKIRDAGWKINSSQVFQNSLIGGTDLHYANYPGADPRVYIFDDDNFSYPIRFTAAQSALASNNTAQPTLTEVNVSNINRAMQRAKLYPTQALRVGVGYLGSTYASSTSEVIEYEKMWDDGVQNIPAIYELRSMTSMPATNLAGVEKNMQTWHAPWVIDNRLTYANEFESTPAFSGNTLDISSKSISTMVEVENVQGHYWNGIGGGGNSQIGQCKPLFVQCLNSGAAAWPPREVRNKLYSVQGDVRLEGLGWLESWPVGPVNNSGYTQCMSDQDHAKPPGNGNKRFEMKLQDIITPDGQETDYNVVISLDSYIELEADYDNLRPSIDSMIGLTTPVDSFLNFSKILGKYNGMYRHGSRGFTHSHMDRQATTFACTYNNSVEHCPRTNQGDNTNIAAINQVKGSYYNALQTNADLRPAPTDEVVSEQQAKKRTLNFD